MLRDLNKVSHLPSKHGRGKSHLLTFYVEIDAGVLGQFGHRKGTGFLNFSLPNYDDPVYEREIHNRKKTGQLSRVEPFSMVVEGF